MHVPGRESGCLFGCQYALSLTHSPKHTDTHTQIHTHRYTHTDTHTYNHGSVISQTDPLSSTQIFTRSRILRRMSPLTPADSRIETQVRTQSGPRNGKFLNTYTSHWLGSTNALILCLSIFRAILLNISGQPNIVKNHANTRNIIRVARVCSNPFTARSQIDDV